jgi:tetratricopeptide (TPR) repeat protein
VIIDAPDVRESPQLAEVRALYERSLCLQALRAAEQIAPLRQWRGVVGRILAARLAMNLGAPRLAKAMIWRAWREHPDDPDAAYYRGRDVLEKLGPLPAWEFVQRVGTLDHASAEKRADWYSHIAGVARALRDFDLAERWLDRAQELAPDRPWLWVERSALLEAQDRYDECLRAARKALELRAWYRPGVQATAHALQLLDRDEEALALLTEAAANAESAPIVGQLALLHYEHRKYREASASLDLFERYSPLLEDEVRQWVASRRCDIACALDDFDAAVEHARQSKHSFQEALFLVDALRSSRGRRRDLLRRHATPFRAHLGGIKRLGDAGVHGDVGIGGCAARSRRPVHVHHRRADERAPAGDGRL